MSGTTISSTYASGITLAAIYTTITEAGSVGNTAANGNAVSGPPGTAWTLVNSGLINETASGGIGVSLAQSGIITNQSGGTIDGYHYAVYMAAGGSLTNQAGGTIVGGTVAGTGGADILMRGAGTVVNAGMIGIAVTGAETYGILLEAGGTVTNQSGGTINASGGFRYGISGSNAAVTVVNAGLLSGGGVNLQDGGSVTNQAGGMIATPGSTYYITGIHVSGAVGTVTNAGTIIASRGIYVQNGGTVINQSTGMIAAYGGAYAVGFTSGFTNLLVADPGAVFIGPVTGGNAIGDGSISTLELASGASTGTLTGLGSQFVDFARVTIDSGATWTLAADAIGAGYAVVDSGTLINTGSLGSEVTLGANGVLTNAANAVITGYAGPGEGNQGSVGVYANAGGSITNQAGGSITGYRAVYGKNTALTVVNAGTMVGSQGGGGTGVFLRGGGSATNQAGGTISGYFGVISDGSATLVNAGTISGRYAVLLQGGSANRLVIDPGAAFSGNVDGGNAVGGPDVSTLELASGASAGTLSGLGSTYVNFTQDTVDAGAQWTLAGANALAAGYTMTNAGTLFDSGALTNAGSIGGSGKIEIGLGVTLIDTGTIAAGQTVAFTGTRGMLDATPAGFYATIGNFQAGDTIALTGVNDITAENVVNGNTLDLTRSSGSPIDLTLDRDYTTADFTTTVVGANTDITTTTVTCFAAGTALDTPDGPVAVEALRVGDLVLTASGQARPIGWIGRQRVDITRNPDPKKVQPIRVLAGALADGSPRRDILLSPDHALLLDGVLIPVRLLRNDATIRREEHCSVITYYHVELDTHDVLLAEGAAAESYLDTGNRDSFENADVPTRLRPDPQGGQHRRETESCVPFVADPARTEPVWRRLAQRAVQLGQTPPEPRSDDIDPMLRVVCAGRSFAPVAVESTCHTFLLPAWQGALRLRSRHAIPNEVAPWIEDQRRLGVMIRQLTVTTASDTRTIPVDDTAVGSGWWDVEREDGAMWRWTDGDAAIAIASAGPCRLDIEVAGTATFARRPAVAPATQAAARGASRPERRVTKKLRSDRK